MKMAQMCRHICRKIYLSSDSWQARVMAGNIFGGDVGAEKCKMFKNIILHYSLGTCIYKHIYKLKMKLYNNIHTSWYDNNYIVYVNLQTKGLLRGLIFYLFILFEKSHKKLRNNY